MSQTLKDVLRIFEFESNNIHVLEQIAGKWETIPLAKLPGFLAVGHVCRMLLDRLEKAGLNWMLDQPLESTTEKPAGVVDDDGGLGIHGRSGGKINVTLEYADRPMFSPNMGIEEILGQVPSLVDEIMKLRRTLRILFSVPLVGTQEWGIKCISDHNSIIREALDATEEQILKRQETDLVELQHDGKPPWED